MKRKAIFFFAVILAAVLPLSSCEYVLPDFGSFFRADSSEERFTISSERVCERGSYGLGTNIKLSGDIDVYVFFMDDDESSWSVYETNAFMKDSVSVALEFIKDKGAEWGISINFTVHEYSTAQDDGFEMRYDGKVNKDLRVDGSTKDVLEQAARCIGYVSADEMHENIVKNNGGREAIYLTAIEKDGISYTRNQTGGNGRYTEHCVLFTEKLLFLNSVMIPKPDTVAHEIFHLFGAEDLYKPSARERAASEICPNDIMLLDTRNIKKLDVCEYTAYTVGWTEEVPMECYIEEWRHD